MKRKWIIPILILAVITAVYLCMLLSTNPVVKTVEDVYCGRISADDDSPIRMYDLSSRYSDIAHAEMNITRLFVLHNWRHGFMYVIYSCEYTDENNKVLNASCSIISRWEIEKRDGEWTVIDIEEKP